MTTSSTGGVLTATDEKVLQYMADRVVYKPLTSWNDAYKEFPRYVLEYLCARYVERDNPIAGQKRIDRLLQEHYVDSDAKELIKSRIKEKGEYVLLGSLQARLDAARDHYWAEVPALGDNYVRINPRVLDDHGEALLTGGAWGTMTILYDARYELGGRIYPFYIREFKPFQITRLDLDDYIAKRRLFSDDEWIDLLITSIGFNPAKFDQRVKLLLLLRLVPFVEPNYNLIELGPRETGKTYTYRNTSGRSFVVSGGKATPATLFYNIATRKIGILGYRHVIFFDEIANTRFGDPEATISVLKDFMQTGRFSRGPLEFSSQASIVLGGNIDTDTARKRPIDRYNQLFEALPPELGTELLRHWAEASGVPFTHWVAEQAPAGVQRRSLHARLLGRDPTHRGVTFESWSDTWQIVAPAYQTQRRIIILDELPYAAEADPAMLSALQHAWDQHFERSQAMIVLCGSHVRTMELLMAYSSPLYGRMTGQWRMQPLPFGALRTFLPGWPADQQVAVYAMVGGVPAYLSWFRTDRSLMETVRDGMLAPGSLAHDEALTLLADSLREPRAYLAILAAIGMGCHTFKAIKEATLLGDVHLPAYLSTLQELRFVERRLPITIPSARQRISRLGRYHLSDPFLRFFFRFLHPHRDILSYAPDRILPLLERDLPAFVEQTTWADLARQWVRARGHQHGLPFVPEVIGSHWSRTVQAPVVAISWTERAIQIGECTWGDAAVDRQTVRDLIDRIVPLTLADLPDKGAGWQVTPALFARAGTTPPARKMLTEAGGMLVDLPRLFADLA